MAKTTLTQVTLLLDRDAGTKIPVVVFDYEQPLLEEIYGGELVHEVESKDVEVEDFDVQAAFDGLVSKYGSNAESDRARKLLYPKLRDLEKKLGVSAKSAKASQPQTSTGGTVKEISERIADMSDDELDTLETEEKAREKPRDGVLSVIESERAKRKVQ